jgi:hypothetical protein
VPKVISAELSFETVRGMLEWRRHYSCVCDDQVERVTLGYESVGASAHTLETIEIELDQFKASAVFRGILSDFTGCGFRLG